MESQTIEKIGCVLFKIFLYNETSIRDLSRGLGIGGSAIEGGC